MRRWKAKNSFFVIAVARVAPAVWHLVFRPMLALALFILAWGASMAALAGPWMTGMEPAAHVYPAIVWILAIWDAIHGAVGAIMQFYRVARSFAGRLTPRHDMDLHNVTLYWHFMLVTALVTFCVVGLFPEALEMWRLLPKEVESLLRCLRRRSSGLSISPSATSPPRSSARRDSSAWVLRRCR